MLGCTCELCMYKRLLFIKSLVGNIIIIIIILNKKGILVYFHCDGVCVCVCYTTCAR